MFLYILGLSLMSESLVLGIWFLNHVIIHNNKSPLTHFTSFAMFCINPCSALLFYNMDPIYVAIAVPFFVSSSFIWLLNFRLYDVRFGDDDDRRRGDDDDPKDPGPSGNFDFEEFDRLRSTWRLKEKV